MFKKPFLKTCCMALMLMYTIGSQAQEFKYENITYYVNSEEDQTCVLSKVTTKFAEYTIPEKVRYNNKDYTVVAIGSSAFYIHKNVKKVTLPSTIKEIRQAAFSGDDLLEEINLPEGLETIGHGAFDGCQSLKSIRIPKSVTLIETRAFFLNKGLKDIVVEEGNPVYDSRNNCNAIIETATDKLLFASQQTVIPVEITEIGDGAFSGRLNIKNLEIPGNVIAIGEQAFYGCEDLETVVLPQGIQKLGYECFVYCQKLQSINLPESLTTFGDRALSGCKTLTTVTLPKTMKTISYGLFSSCELLAYIEIPDSVTVIESNAFYECKSLQQITIPTYVREVGDRIFTKCENLTDIYNLSPIPQKSDYNESVFGSLDGKDGVKLHVYNGFKSDYEASERWNKVTIVDDIPLVPITSIEMASDLYVPYVSYGLGYLYPVIKPENASIKRLNWTYPNGNYHAVPFSYYTGCRYTIYSKGDTEFTATALDKGGASATIKVHVGGEAPSAISNTVSLSEGQSSAIYSLNGTRIHSNGRGIVIKRMTDGTVRKIIR
ncbi:MAG: leucine-rich repeat domain-containing protein [Prevotella sp.]|nr:leucine-rich repeat domain-containing protein [Prevotella sp.]